MEIAIPSLCKKCEAVELCPFKCMRKHSSPQAIVNINVMHDKDNPGQMTGLQSAFDVC